MTTTTVPIPRAHKVFYAVILIAAVVIAAGGILVPSVLAEQVSWLVLPPLHARFLGAIYLFGTVYTVGCLLARSQHEVRYALPLIAIFTGLLFVVSVLNLGAFDAGRLPVLIWLTAYAIFPVVALGLFARVARPWPADPASPDLPPWARAFLLIQGAVVSVPAVALFVLPQTMTTVWPWPVTAVLAQAYSGPLLSYGLASLLASQFRTWREVRVLVPAMLAFTAVTVVASVVHSGVFGAFDPVDVAWFGCFAAATGVLGAMTVQLARGLSRRTAEPAGR